LCAASSSIPFTLTALFDADWAFIIDDSTSTFGAQYRSLAQASTGLLWIQAHLRKQHFPFSTLLLYDKQRVVAHNPISYSKTEHMEIDIIFVHKQVLS